MPLEPRPPFRADQVGSLLRPGSLHEARAKAKRGEIDAQALRTIEDRCIREAVAKQEAIGLSGITDGEFRRDWWHIRNSAHRRALSLQPLKEGKTICANPGVCVRQHNRC